MAGVRGRDVDEFTLLERQVKEESRRPEIVGPDALLHRHEDVHSGLVDMVYPRGSKAEEPLVTAATQQIKTIRGDRLGATLVESTDRSSRRQSCRPRAGPERSPARGPCRRSTMASSGQRNASRHRRDVGILSLNSPAIRQVMQSSASTPGSGGAARRQSADSDCRDLSGPVSMTCAPPQNASRAYTTHII